MHNESSEEQFFRRMANGNKELNDLFKSLLRLNNVDCISLKYFGARAEKHDQLHNLYTSLVNMSAKSKKIEKLKDIDYERALNYPSDDEAYNLGTCVDFSSISENLWGRNNIVFIEHRGSPRWPAVIYDDPPPRAKRVSVQPISTNYWKPRKVLKSLCHRISQDKIDDVEVRGDVPADIYYYMKQFRQRCYLEKVTDYDSFYSSFIQRHADRKQLLQDYKEKQSPEAEIQAKEPIDEGSDSEEFISISDTESIGENITESEQSAFLKEMESPRVKRFLSQIVSGKRKNCKRNNYFFNPRDRFRKLQHMAGYAFLNRSQRDSFVQKWLPIVEKYIDTASPTEYINLVLMPEACINVIKKVRNCNINAAENTFHNIFLEEDDVSHYWIHKSALKTLSR